MTDLSAAIIAGGQGQRLGGAVKPLLEYRGARIIDRQLDVLRSVAGSIIVCSSRSAPFASLGLVVVDDEPSADGPIAGVISALQWADRPLVFVVAGDMPLLSAPVIELLVERARANPDVDVVAPRLSGCAQPLHAVYRASAAVGFRRAVARGVRSPRRVLESADLRVEWIGDNELREIDAELSFATNVNVPADLP